MSFIIKAQQLPYFSQYMFNSYFLNPAVAGTGEVNPAMLSFRNQWTGLKDAPVTATASMHTKFGDNMGIGGMLFNDQTGPIKRTGIQLSYAYHVEITDESKLSFGLGGLMYQYYINKSELRPDEEDDLVLMNQKVRSLVPDAIFGAYYTAPKWYVGFSIPQLFQHKLNFTNDNDLKLNKLVRHYFIHGGYKFDVNESIQIEPSTLLKFLPNTPFQFDLNAKVLYKKMLWGGVSYRLQESVVFMTGIQKGNFKIGFSYDATLSNLRKYSSGTQEVFISFDIPSGEKSQPRFD
jgi:type IX secretion system PorP/SprF family membrane protein